MSTARDSRHDESTAHDDFWRLVDVALDERRDPLEDPDVARRLAEDPRLFVEYDRLDRALRDVAWVQAPSVPAQVSAAPVARRWALRVAALAASVLVVLAWARSPRAVTRSERVLSRATSTPVPVPDASLARVHALHIDVIDERPEARVVTRFDGERFERTVERRSGSRGDAGGGLLVLHSTTITSESFDSSTPDGLR